MIERPVTFILGAGASCPYRFPSGRDLIFQIQAAALSIFKSASRNGRRDWLSFDSELVLQCGHQLLDSHMSSVDEFLESHPHYEDVGKHLIAAALIPREHPQHLRREFRSGRPSELEWLEYLFGEMTAGASTPESFTRNCVSFITFNYDRVVEQFFYDSLQHAYGLDGPAALKLLEETVTIVHPYGLLGSFDPLGEGIGRPFANSADDESIRIAAAEIKVIHQGGGATSLAAFEEANEILGQADVVLFLGFGFHADNIKRLKDGLLAKSFALVAGSCYGMQGRETAKAIERVATNPALQLRIPSWMCIDFLRNTNF